MVPLRVSVVLPSIDGTFDYLSDSRWWPHLYRRGSQRYNLEGLFKYLYLPIRLRRPIVVLQEVLQVIATLEDGLRYAHCCLLCCKVTKWTPMEVFFFGKT